MPINSRQELSSLITLNNVISDHCSYLFNCSLEWKRAIHVKTYERCRLDPPTQNATLRHEPIVRHQDSLMKPREAKHKMMGNRRCKGLFLLTQESAFAEPFENGLEKLSSQGETQFPGARENFRYSVFFFG